MMEIHTPSIFYLLTHPENQAKIVSAMYVPDITCQVSIERFATLSKFIKRQFLARERLRRGQYRWCSVKDDPCELAILRGLNKLDNLISII